MDYTSSNAFATDAGTGQRLHQQSAAIPTAVTDVDMNGPIWELLAVIKAGGLTPQAFDKTVANSYTQLLQALPGALASRPEMARSLAINGYQKLPGGLLVQWGYDVGNTGDHNITYPISFPSAVYCVLATTQYGSSNSQQVLSVATGNVGQLAFFSAYPRYFGSATGGIAVQPFNWVALGK